MSVYESLISLSSIHAGWSGDKKYCAVDKDGKKYFLRITPPEKAEKAKRSFEKQTRWYALGVPMCEPIECGGCADGFYTLQSFVEGEDAEEAVPRLPESKQYALGYESGAILQKIHSVPAPTDAQDWETRFNAKIDRKIDNYNKCPIKVEGADRLLEYAEGHRALLRGRPQCSQHGDYHIGNMMIEKGKLTVIDFDRCDWGDPWEEFNRIVWCAQKSPRFACGMVDGYFGGSVPAEFWDLLALYIGSNTLSSIPWAIPFGEQEVKTMIRQTKEVLAWYDGMTKTVPGWYEKI